MNHLENLPTKPQKPSSTEKQQGYRPPKMPAPSGGGAGSEKK
jgi:hypothetical protein